MAPTDQYKKLGLAIVGGGRGGLELLRLFHQEKGIEILGIADKRPEAPAIKFAQSVNIPTTTDFGQLIHRDGVDLIADLTGNPDVRLQIVKDKAPHVELLGGVSAKLMWNFIEMLERKVEERTQELKEVQEELLRNKLAMLQQISSGVSHELQSPLGVIKNSVAYLSDKMTDYPKNIKHLKIIDQEIIIAEKIINDLADFVKPVDWIFASNDLQQQLIQSEKLAQVGIMAAGIAHEVNNPLSVMLGKAEMILEEEDPARVKKYAQEIIKYAKKASDIVKGITFYSRVTTAPGTERRIYLNAQLNEAIKLSKYSTSFDDIELVTDYQDIPPVRGNAGEIQQVFVNLMKNAVQAMNGKGRLLVSSRYEDGSVVVTIRDTGAGIKKEHLKQIFTPFFTTKDPGRGTGLGLNIVHKIITNHGGSISVESEEGQGAAFIVRLPPTNESPPGEDERWKMGVEKDL
ncbi:MAG TPA: ATP-binding protein [Nitrospiria bacterium]|nr:ATP-binding protein [Nitrospiria bacterium]